MSPKSRIKLDQIRIASPCPTSWESMIGNDRVRFCNICSKNVYNLSSLSRAQAEDLIHEMRGKLCAQIYLRKDGSIMTTDCPVGLSAIRKRVLKRLAGVAAAVITLISGSTYLTLNKKHDISIANQVVHSQPEKRKPEVNSDENFEQLRSLGGYITSE